MRAGVCARGMALALVLIACARGQAGGTFRVEVRAVMESGDPIPKARVALVPTPAASRPVAKCAGGACENAGPGRHVLMVFAEGMITIKREVEISRDNQVLFVEMAPLVIAEPNFPGMRSVFVHAPKSVLLPDRNVLSIRLIGVLSGVVRSAPARVLPVEFANLPTGRYLVYLLRSGRCVGARVFRHNEDEPSHVVLDEGAGGCDVRIR